MDLADFIDANIRALVDDWAEYALAISQEESQLSESQLRNSAVDILTAIAADMREPQNAEQQEAKSRGEKHATYSNVDLHGILTHGGCGHFLGLGYVANPKLSRYSMGLR